MDVVVIATTVIGATPPSPSPSPETENSKPCLQYSIRSYLSEEEETASEGRRGPKEEGKKARGRRTDDDKLSQCQGET